MSEASDSLTCILSTNLNSIWHATHSFCFIIVGLTWTLFISPDTICFALSTLLSADDDDESSIGIIGISLFMYMYMPTEYCRFFCYSALVFSTPAIMFVPFLQILSCCTEIITLIFYE